MPTEASEVSSAAADQLKSSKPVQLNPHTCTYQLFVRWRRATFVTSSAYKNALKKLLDESNYPVKISRDQLFRDLFVHGLHNQDVQRQLFQRDATKLTVEDVCIIAISYESTSPLQSTEQPSEHQMTTTQLAAHSALSPEPIVSTLKRMPNANVKSSRFQHQHCNGCGAPAGSHLRSDCPAQHAVCTNCTGLHHYATVCRRPQSSAVAVSYGADDDQYNDDTFLNHSLVT